MTLNEEYQEIWNDFEKNIKAGVDGVVGEVIQRELFWWMWE